MIPDLPIVAGPHFADAAWFERAIADLAAAGLLPERPPSAREVLAWYAARGRATDPVELDVEIVRAFTPERIWYQDLECDAFSGNGVYAAALQAWGRLLHERVAEVREVGRHGDPMRLSFRAFGARRTMVFSQESDWMSLAPAVALNAMRPSAHPRELHTLEGDWLGQRAAMVALAPQEKRILEARGWEFFERRPASPIERAPIHGDAWVALGLPQDVAPAPFRMVPFGTFEARARSLAAWPLHALRWPEEPRVAIPLEELEAEATRANAVLGAPPRLYALARDVRDAPPYFDIVLVAGVDLAEPGAGPLRAPMEDDTLPAALAAVTIGDVDALGEHAPVLVGVRLASASMDEGWPGVQEGVTLPDIRAAFGQARRLLAELGATAEPKLHVAWRSW